MRLNGIPLYAFQFQHQIRIRREHVFVKCWVKADLQAGEDEPPVTIRLQEMNTWEEFAIAEYGNWHFWQEISAEGSFSANPNREGLVQVRVKIQVAAGYAAYFDDVKVEEIL